MDAAERTVDSVKAAAQAMADEESSTFAAPTTSPLNPPTNSAPKTRAWSSAADISGTKSPPR
jgi:hypothetical protein